MLSGSRALVCFGAELLNNPANPCAYFGGGPVMGSALEVFAHASAPRGKPDFGLTSTAIDGKRIAVREAIECRKPFGQLKHFVREGIDGGPKLLIVEPMSGHYRSEEHTSELQSLMRISYAVFCLKKKKILNKIII